MLPLQHRTKKEDKRILKKGDKEKGNLYIRIFFISEISEKGLPL
jgi:hypothetical protein